MHKLYGYVNGGHGEQDSKIQREILKRYAGDAKLKYKEIYEDRGPECPGASESGPGHGGIGMPQYKALREAVKSGDRIIMIDTDAISRDMITLYGELDFFANKDVRVEFVELPIVNTGDVGLDIKINHMLLKMRE